MTSVSDSSYQEKCPASLYIAEGALSPLPQMDPRNPSVTSLSVPLTIRDPSLFHGLQQQMRDRRTDLFDLLDQILGVPRDEVCGRSQLIFNLLALSLVRQLPKSGEREGRRTRASASIFPS